MLSVEKRIENEKRIYRKMVKMLAERGWNLYRVSDGEEKHKVADANEALDHVFGVDESWTYFKKDAAIHVIYIILGNGNDGYDMISDYSFTEGDPDGFEAAMNEVCNWIGEEECK